jgi:oligoribonuclease NrnB/cAMP/cGMP phosphodiesterase (DHH superfamily)
MNKQIKCFYHSSDFDGYCSGAIVGHIYGWDNVEFYPINYGDEFPWDVIDQNSEVFMVDFSLPSYEDMIKLNKKCHKFHWIDHHDTAIQKENDYLKENPEIIPPLGLRPAGNNKAACELTWEYLSDKQTPLTVQLLGQYDVGNWMNVENSLEFQYGLNQFSDLDPKTCSIDEIETWELLLSSSYSRTVYKIIEMGKIISDYKKSDNYKRAKNSVFMTELDGYPVLALNADHSNSQIFDSVIENYPDAKALMLFYFNKNYWLTSLYHIEDRTDRHLGELCQKFGGGGHKGAAGFKWNKWPLPFEIPF